MLFVVIECCFCVSCLCVVFICCSYLNVDKYETKITNQLSCAIQLVFSAARIRMSFHFNFRWETSSQSGRRLAGMGSRLRAAKQVPTKKSKKYLDTRERSVLRKKQKE